MSTEPLGSQLPLEQPKFIWRSVETENGKAAIRVKWVPNLHGSGRPGAHFFVQYRYAFLVKCLDTSEENLLLNISVIRLYGRTTYESTEPELYEDYIIVRGLEQGETYVFRVVAVDGTLTSTSDEEEIYTYAGMIYFCILKDNNLFRK